MKWLNVVVEEESSLAEVEVLRVSPESSEYYPQQQQNKRIEEDDDDDWVPQYRLLYFNLRGIVEGVRLLLALAEIRYEDWRYPMRASGRGFGVDRAFLRDQENGIFKSNMNSLPILEIVENDGGWQLGQSGAILRYLAAKHGKFGKTERDRAQIDAVLEHVREIQQKWYKAKRRPSTTQKQMISSLGACVGYDNDDAERTVVSDKLTFLDDDLPKLLKTMENAVPTNPLPWLVGIDPSVADVAVYHLLATPETIITGNTASFFDGDRDRVRAALARAPRLRACVSAFSKLPTIQHWEANRPDTFA
mmetsp:Transcript_22913/g.73675  ORF Transcript_22913/g.73675 Transcript_22913/m.73675 type:complete len:305 (+) Transcript_22913:66-980(+)